MEEGKRKEQSGEQGERVEGGREGGAGGWLQMSVIFYDVHIGS